MDSAAEYALAYALTTSAGLRGLLTLAVVSLAVHFGWLHPPAGFAWLGGNVVTIILCFVALLDFAGDKIPMLDHVLHAVNLIIKPAAAAVIVGGSTHPHSAAELGWLMALGALNALGVGAASATVRGTTSVTTAGLANPLVSFSEDVLSVGTMVLAFAAPLVAAAIAIVLTIVAVRLAISAWRAARVAVPASR